MFYGGEKKKCTLSSKKEQGRDFQGKQQSQRRGRFPGRKKVKRIFTEEAEDAGDFADD